MLNVYLYSVSVVSLSAFYVAVIILVNNALSLVFGLALDAETRQGVAGSVGVIASAFPMWWVHWRWLRREFERASANQIFFHRFYLFTIICLSAMAMLISGSVGISQLLGLALALHDSVAAGLQKTLAASLVFGVSAGLWRHHWRQFRGNLGEFFPPQPAAEIA